ncbi:DUF4362 domain-containing protein [Clostridium hydrogenum]|uniref:DUF4362 domain-containing protein n=1 Tax=Clostridium hydrogenum TaxID=2855764 RepID=UPI002E30C6CE|nr:DUF4362 domain-containing protein [Clostridium hydrogenum]
MKKHILLAGICGIALIINGCTNNSSNISTKTNVVRKTSNYKVAATKDTKALDVSYKEGNNLIKPYLEDARDLQKSIRNGSVIMISKKSNGDFEVYNTASLDNFINCFNSGKQSYVRVIKGISDNNGSLLVNKLEEYETDGKVIKDTAYDTYSNKDKFIPAKPIYLYKMLKMCSGNSIRYSTLQSKDTPKDMDGTVISFLKSSIKN